MPVFMFGGHYWSQEIIQCWGSNLGILHVKHRFQSTGLFLVLFVLCKMIDFVMYILQQKRFKCIAQENMIIVGLLTTKLLEDLKLPTSKRNQEHLLLFNTSSFQTPEFVNEVTLAKSLEGGWLPGEPNP